MQVHPVERLISGEQFRQHQALSLRKVHSLTQRLEGLRQGRMAFILSVLMS